MLKVFVVPSLLIRVTSVGENAQTWWFTLNKWASNCPEVLQIIPVEDRIEANEFTLNAESSILCLEWIFNKDCLQVCRGPSEKSPQNITQRVLSFVSSVFDP